MLPLTVATEDELSEAVAQRRLLDFPSLEVGLWLRRGGNGYLRSRIRKFCEMARHSPVLVITDLDTNTCPAALCRTWLGNLSHPPGLLLRVAVREVEAWLLADHDAMVALIGKHAKGRMPDNPDDLHDPKDRLLELAKRAPRAVRLDLRAEAGAVARQGLGYNHRLCALVRYRGVLNGPPNDRPACGERSNGLEQYRPDWKSRSDFRPMKLLVKL